MMIWATGLDLSTHIDSLRTYLVSVVEENAGALVGLLGVFVAIFFVLSIIRQIVRGR